MKLKTCLSNINLAITFLLLSWFFSPYLTRNMSKLVIAMLLILWLASAIIIILNNKKIFIFHSVYLWLIAYGLFTIFYKTIEYSSHPWSTYCYKILVFFIIFVFYFYKDYMDRSKLKVITCYSIFLYLFNLIDNIRLTYIYPNGSAALNFPSGEIYQSMNIGATYFVSGITIFTCFCIGSFVGQKKQRIFYCITAILGMIFCVMSQRTTSLILILLSIVFYFIHWGLKRFSYKQKLAILFFICFVCLGFYIILPYILEMISDHIESPLISSRLDDLATFLKEGAFTENGSFSTRIELQLMSFKTFCLNILTGVGYHNAVDGNYNLVGQHSEILDAGAKYGLIGFISLLAIIVLFYKENIQVYKNKPFFYAAQISYFVYFILAVWSIVTHPTIFIVVYFMIPSILVLYKEKSER